MKVKRVRSDSDPVVFSEGSVIVKLYPTVNRIYRRDSATGERHLKSEHPQFTLTYYRGNKRVKRKFSDRAEAEAETVQQAQRRAQGLRLAQPAGARRR